MTTRIQNTLPSAPTPAHAEANSLVTNGHITAVSPYASPADLSTEWLSDVAISALEYELSQITDAALWLYAAQFLDETASESESEEVSAAPAKSALGIDTTATTVPKPAVEFDANIKCYSTPDCTTLSFATIQEFQWHIMTHAKTSDAPRQLSKCTVARAPRQRLQQRRLAYTATRRRRSHITVRLNGRRRSLPSHMAALSLSDRTPSALQAAH